MGAKNLQGGRGPSDRQEIAGQQLQAIGIHSPHCGRSGRQRRREHQAPYRWPVGPPWLKVPVAPIGDPIELSKLQ